MFNISFCLIETHRVVIVKFRTRTYTGLPTKDEIESSETTVHNTFSLFFGHNHGCSREHVVIKSSYFMGN